MKDDYVTKEEFKNGVEELIRQMGLLHEDVLNKIDGAVESLIPNAERPIRNEERLDQHETILQKHDIEIKVLQQTK